MNPTKHARGRALQKTQRRPTLPSDPDELPDLAQLEFVIQDARKAADCQWDAWKQADARIQFLLGLAVSMVTLGLALGVGRDLTSPAARPLVAFALTNLLGAVGYLALAYRSDGFSRVWGSVRLEHVGSFSPRAARELAVLRLGRAYESNEMVLHRKLRRSRRGFLLLTLGGIAGVAAVVRTGWSTG
jgi:hypothetical protein